MKSVEESAGASDEEVERRVNENLPLANFMAARWQHMDPAEALSTALAGLLAAAREYRPGKGVPFGSFASLRMKWMMGRAGKLKQRVKSGGRAIHIALDAPRGSDEDVTLAELIPDPAALPWESGEQDRAHQLIITCIGRLPERWNELICRRFGIGYDPHTLQEIGAVFGISRERVRQLEVKALTMLRKLHQEATWHALSNG